MNATSLADTFDRSTLVHYYYARRWFMIKVEQLLGKKQDEEFGQKGNSEERV